MTATADALIQELDRAVTEVLGYFAGSGRTSSARVDRWQARDVLQHFIYFHDATAWGIQSVALPMVQEFGYTREIEDRVLAPLPVSLVAIQKAMTGACNGLFAALLVFPIAAIVPATPVHLDINWPVLLTLTPLACYMCGALGLTFGTRFDPRTVPMLFGIVVLPLTFLGAIYYSWESLAPIEWLQILVLVNPLVYMCEGFRAALTTSEHMSLWAVYPVMIAFSALFTWLGIAGFKKRVLS